MITFEILHFGGLAMDKKKIFAVFIGIVVLLAFVIHPGVPDKRVPLKINLQ